MSKQEAAPAVSGRTDTGISLSARKLVYGAEKLGFAEANGDNEKIAAPGSAFEFDEDKDEENSPIPMVAEAISNKDTLGLPCLTFRFWILSTFFTVLGATLAEFYYFRSTGAGYSILFVLLASFVLGTWMARVLPTQTMRLGGWEFSLNPGPFNIKEHLCIVVATSAGGGSAYATDIIAIQELFYGHHSTFVKGILLILSTQIIGYGLAGFCRKYLVRPAEMVWPSTLVTATVFNTLHGNAREAESRMRFFAIAFSCVFVWQFLPQYVFPWLTSMAILCLALPGNPTAAQIGSGYHGLGVLDFTLDWNAIGHSGPLHMPWWAQCNYYFGVVLGAWIIAPLLYYNNVMNAKTFPMLATYSLDKDGNRYNQTRVTDMATGALNVTAFEEYSPVYLSVTFAANYCYSFIAFTAALSHVALFHGSEIARRFRARRDEAEDVHCRLMNAYEDIPNWWFATIFGVMLAIAIALCHVTEAHLPWWGLLLAVALASVMVLPIGMIQAISSNQVSLNVIAEMVCGYILPGLPIANVYFKCYGYMTVRQCLSLVRDFKIGHYMKVPPRSMFAAQMWGTVVGAVVNYFTLMMIIEAKRPYLDGTLDDPTGQWTGRASQLFDTASIVWGLIGPARTFGAGSPYHVLLLGFLGFLAPLPIWLLHRRYPGSGFNHINIPIICAGLAVLPGSYTNFITVGFVAGFASQFWAYNYHRNWWSKYNYVLSAACNSAAQIVTLITFFTLNGVNTVKFPEWWGNNQATQGERCFNVPQ